MLDPIDFHALFLQRSAEGGAALAGEASVLGQA